MSEWLLFRLAPTLGKMQAQEHLLALLKRADAEKISFKDLLMQDVELSAQLNENDLEMLDHPERYTGLAVELAADTLAEILSIKEHDTEVLTR